LVVVVFLPLTNQKLSLCRLASYSCLCSIYPVRSI